MGDDQVDALMYAYNQHTHAQAPRVALIPDSIGYCPFCHDLVECYQRDWGEEKQPECGRSNVPVSRDGQRGWCANRLHDIKGRVVGDLVWASYVLGGYQAALATWADHGHPPLAYLDR